MREACKCAKATVRRLFRTSNLARDLFCRYGFDEASGSFQLQSWWQGQRAVVSDARDGSGCGNANSMALHGTFFLSTYQSTR